MATVVVTNTDTGASGSLVFAIAQANDDPGPDTITFNIPGDGPHSIEGPANALPIRGEVTIDGHTQPGPAPNSSQDPNVNDARIMVNIVDFGFGGLNMVVRGERASGSRIPGLAFLNTGPKNKDPRWGLERRDADNVTVDGCVFRDPELPGPPVMSRAVIIGSGDHNTIGSDVALIPARLNVMCGYLLPRRGRCSYKPDAAASGWLVPAEMHSLALRARR
jgi:hypothetical protein